MDRFEFVAYESEKKKLWDDFVKASRNGTFLLMRDYMDYHADKFYDASLLAYRNGKLCAILPANIANNHLYSHQGLTYGGWITPINHFYGVTMLQLWENWIDYCRNIGISTIHYKPMPHIYTSIPAQEDIYALFRCNAQIEVCNLSSAIDMTKLVGFNMSKRQQLKKAHNKNITIEMSSDYEQFWEILESCLQERHEASPVHSLEEIRRLSSLFPDNIKLFTVSDEEGIQAGVCIYDTGIVAHSQYTATTEKARNNYYLTALYNHLITSVYNTRKYFDFGTSNENKGLILNEGLLNQKYSMGATGVVYTQYLIQL